MVSQTRLSAGSCFGWVTASVPGAEVRAAVSSEPSSREGVTVLMAETMMEGNVTGLNEKNSELSFGSCAAPVNEPTAVPARRTIGGGAGVGALLALKADRMLWASWAPVGVAGPQSTR